MTPRGFIPKRLAEIHADINAGLANITDTATGARPFQNATDDTILQQIVGVFSEALSEVWSAAYAASVQFDPLKNIGAGQSGTVQLNALLRKPGAPTILQMRLEGVAGTIIPAGSRIANTQGNLIFATDRAATIGVGGFVEVPAVSTINGPQNLPVATITTIQTPVGGWRAARNTATLSVGTNEETDEELRVRQQRSTSLTAYRTIDAIYAAIMAVPGVSFARIYQNATVSPVDARGIPFKEVAAVVEGGAARAIADALFLRLPMGQVGFGSTTETVRDIQNIAHPISFSRPAPVNIFVHVEIRVVNSAVFPSDATARIAQNIVDFATRGDAGHPEGFPPGGNIVLSRLFSPINRVPGLRINHVLIGTAATTLAGTDIVIAWNQVGRFDASRITVTTVP